MSGTKNGLRAILLAAFGLSIVAVECANRCLSVMAVLSPMPVGAPAKGLRLVATIDQTSFRENDSIELKVRLTNGTGRVVYVTESNALADYRIEVRNENGTLVPPTTEGERLLRLSLFSTRRLSVAIPPGQEKNQSFDVNKIYAMPPGRYEITVKREVTTVWQKKGVQLTSNVARVTIRA